MCDLAVQQVRAYSTRPTPLDVDERTGEILEMAA
jgi:hypothetical protein